MKWNAPSYFYGTCDMAAFNLRQEKFVQLIFIFPKGLIQDTSGMLGHWADRREVRFSDMREVELKKEIIKKVVNDWLELIRSQEL